MGSLKRKEAPGGDNPSKKAKSSKNAQPSKRIATKGDAPTRNGVDTKKRKTDADTVAAAPNRLVSVLKDDEPMLPRGGASVLTPLEQKQIQIQARADAIAEDEFDTTEKTKTKAKKLRRKESKASILDGSAKGKAKNSVDEDGVKIESLNFKVGAFFILSFSSLRMPWNRILTPYSAW